MTEIACHRRRDSFSTRYSLDFISLNLNLQNICQMMKSLNTYLKRLIICVKLSVTCNTAKLLDQTKKIEIVNSAFIQTEEKC